jgi:lipopolysaccharide heptosyltransferase II
MKAVDQHVGRLLCSLASPLLGARPGTMPAPGAVRSIALVKFWGMGSIMLMTPAIAALKAKYPDATLTFVTQEANRSVIGLLPDVDDMLALDVGHGPARFLASLARLVAQVRARRFDLWIDFEFLTRFSALLTGISGAKTRAGFDAPEVERGRFHEVLAPFNSGWHIIDNFCVLALGELTPPETERPLERLKPRPEAVASVGNTLASRGLALGEPYLILNPNAGELALERRWSVDRFARLADEVCASFPGKVVVIGAKAERDYVRQMTSQVKRQDRLIDLCGETSVEELLALFAGARLMVSNDTGPLHLACAAGTPTVAIFGPETPTLVGPRGPQHRVVFKNLACSPCLNIYNGRSVSCRFAETFCVTTISVLEVLAVVREQLAKDGVSLPEGEGARQGS